MKRYFVSYLFNFKEHNSLNFGNITIQVEFFNISMCREHIKEEIFKEFSNVFSNISRDDICVGIMFFKELKDDE